MSSALLLAADILATDTPLTVGLVVLVVSCALAVGESRWQIAHLREWKREADADAAALRERVTALEVRESRTLERIDHLTTQLVRIEAKLDKLLERRESA